MPTGDMAGWKQIFSDDFTTNVPLGKFPSAVANKWDAYPYPWTGTPTTGTYSPERTTSVANGMMDIWLHSEVVDGVMKHLISAPEPRINGPAPAGLGQLYGRYAVRFKTDKFPYYKPSWLLWPTSETWPRDGEIDFPEGNFDGNICGFMHRQGGTSGSDQDAYCTSTPVAGAWHTAVIEWLPNHLRLLLDGKVIGESTSRVPNTPMRYVLQNGVRFDTPNPDNATQGHVYIDWVAVYKPA